MPRFLAILLFCLLPNLGQAARLHVVLVPSGNAPPYRSFSDTFRQSLQGNIQFEEVKPESFTGREKADLVVAVGVRAADIAVKKTDLPIIAAMLPSYVYAALKSVRPTGLSAIFVDQPWERQASFLRLAFPERRQIGMLVSSVPHLDFDKLRTALQANGDNLNSETVTQGALFEKLEQVLARSQILLALPDNAIYNSNSIRDILLSSYRHRVPLVGFSEAFVNAGALCAIYSTAEQLAAQAGSMVNGYAKGGVLPDAEYPKMYTVLVNQEVAGMLGIAMPSKELLVLKLERERAIR